ncbi:interleukin-31 receptor subunit alpha [Xenentodon cancila]
MSSHLAPLDASHPRRFSSKGHSRLLLLESCKSISISDDYQHCQLQAELTVQPVIDDFKDASKPAEKACRLISGTWKFPSNELHDGYYVTVGKSSGEAPELLTTSRPEIKLILSSSAYQISISAFNNVSTSPSVSYTIPERGDMAGSRNGRLNVTVHNSTSFTVYWKRHVIRKYVCYSVEWKTKGSKVLYTSFHQINKNYKVLSPLPEPLKPYHRYSITLHTRPNKDTCNMKHINNSESTYGSTQFYYMEGSPVGAPTNISSHNMTTNSVVLEWSSIRQEDIRGFLLGFIIHCSEYHHRDTGNENDVIVGPLLNNHKLGDLKSGTPYQVQISGFTSAGPGARSSPLFFKTNHEGNRANSLITVLAVLTTALIFGPPMIKRIKAVLWPSIPDPGSSNAVQKIDWTCQLELLEEMTTLTAEEWYTKSLQVLDRDEVVPASTSPSILPLLCASELEGDSQLTPNWVQSDEDSTAGDIFPEDSTGAFLETRQTDPQRPHFAFASDYTTMEMFQQLMPGGTSGDRDVTPTAGKSPLDYVKQFSTSPTADGEQTTTTL